MQIPNGVPCTLGADFIEAPIERQLEAVRVCHESDIALMIELRSELVRVKKALEALGETNEKP